MTASARAEINRTALANNLARVRSLAPGADVMAVVKANAYGHGIVPVARALAGADALAVARMSEAIAIRDAGCTGRLVLLEGVMLSSELDLAARYGLDLVVHRRDQIDMLRASGGPARFDVWLKIDTGMNRLGFRPEEARAAWAALRDSAAVNDDIRLMTHLASADKRGNAHTRTQLSRFQELTADWSGERSIANSAGVLAWPDSHADWVRPGLMLYGVSPIAGRDADSLGLEPVMTLWSRLIAVKAVRAGERVGYGGRWVARHDTMIGTVAAGYGDGYPWRVSSGTPVLINDRRVGLAGQVSMDMLAVDLGPNATDKVGDRAVLWGDGLPVEEIATAAGTIPYELICGISQRVTIEMRSARVPDVAPVRSAEAAH